MSVLTPVSNGTHSYPLQVLVFDLLRLAFDIFALNFIYRSSVNP